MDILEGCGHTCMANCKPSFKLATVMDYMVRYFSETLVNVSPTGTSQKSFGHKPQSAQLSYDTKTQYKINFLKINPLNIIK